MTQAPIFPLRCVALGILGKSGEIAPSRFHDGVARQEQFPTLTERPADLLLGSVSSIRGRMEFRDFVGSCLPITGLLGAGAVSIFPVMLRSTLGSEYSLTAYNSAASRESLAVAAIWWPIALMLAVGYSLFILRHFRGKVKPSGETNGFY